MQGMLDRGLLEAVYDVTIAYPDTRPDTELDIIRGGLPGQVRGSAKYADFSLGSLKRLNNIDPG